MLMKYSKGAHFKFVTFQRAPGRLLTRRVNLPRNSGFNRLETAAQ